MKGVKGTHLTILTTVMCVDSVLSQKGEKRKRNLEERKKCMQTSSVFSCSHLPKTTTFGEISDFESYETYYVQ